MYNLGADPEVFLANKETKEIVPVCGLFGGTKARPKRMVTAGKGYYYQEDNVMLEFNVPATTSPSGLGYAVIEALQWIRSKLEREYPHLELSDRNEYLFPFAQLANPHANRFGCAPDFNAYEMGQTYPQITKEDLATDYGEWRMAGGHIHIGYTTVLPAFVAAQLADALIGVPCVALDRQNVRRGLYGQAGRYRPTSYGIEYRTLSNSWIMNQKKMLTVCQHAANFANIIENRTLAQLQELYAEIPWSDVRACINNEDTKQAKLVGSYIRGLTP